MQWYLMKILIMVYFISFFFQFVVKTMFCHFYDVQHDALDECSLTFFFSGVGCVFP